MNYKPKFMLYNDMYRLNTVFKIYGIVQSSLLWAIFIDIFDVILTCYLSDNCWNREHLLLGRGLLLIWTESFVSNMVKIWNIKNIEKDRYKIHVLCGDSESWVFITFLLREFEIIIKTWHVEWN